ncbi:type-F conjugative transfer system protein TrbI [Vibrio ouci]|uniref:Type-F conjugative transfer system protein TrbI n=1 Tax=Vibrio ouci TaxID=2499078 RepID=A0A4Y8W9P4_9VIBR|nr:type-F conjugative transfer system protein TrbI [Vibrio ouci]TFH89366.1 type-F conjugative transfer system protein TrbI [Vibrio ouci]
MKTPLSTMTLMVSVSLLSALAAYALLAQNTPRLVSVDVKSTLTAYHQELVKTDISLEEQTQRLTRFADIMDEEIAKYNARHNTIALVSAAVVGGAMDITPQIQRAIVQRYQEKESR